MASRVPSGRAVGILMTLLLAFACGGDGGGTDDEPRVVTNVIEAVTSGEADRIEAVIDYQTERCIPQAEGPGAPPPCPPGEAEGFAVEGIWNLFCEGIFVPRDELNLKDAVATEGEFYGAYAYDAFPAGARFIVIFTPHGSGANSGGTGFVTNESGIIAIHHGLGCSLTTEQFIEREQLGTPVATR